MKSIRLECFLPYIGILLFITRSQCPHCSNFILCSLFSALLTILFVLRFASLCSQSAPQNAIEVHRTSSCSMSLCSSSYGTLSKSTGLLHALLAPQRNLLRRPLSKSTGLLHAAICSKTDSKSQEINL